MMESKSGKGNRIEFKEEDGSKTFFLQSFSNGSLFIDHIFPDSTLRGKAELGDNNQVAVALVLYLW